jgi:hypothetical protein
MDQRERARGAEQLIRLCRSNPAAARTQLTGHATAGTNATAASRTPAPAANPSLFWFDDVSVVESGVLRKATAEELASRN